MSHTTEFTCKYCGKDTTVEGLADIPVCPACQASLALKGASRFCGLLRS
jgi:ribosomal protein L37AE/L43A